MPELPEVETARRSFAERIRGAQVLAVRRGKPLRWPLGIEPTALVGQQVGEVSRRGKYLWLPLTEGGLLMHLGMSGSLAFSRQPEEPGAHDHFDLVTSAGTLRLADPRRFGAVVWSSAMDADPAARLLGSLGLEPFDEAFDGDYLHRALRGRRVAIKQALLAGDIVVGAGNIYACEALFEAGIDPRTRAGALSRPRCVRLALAIRCILGQALTLGGATLRDFRDAHGMAGQFQLHAKVYGRVGEPCVVCGSTLRRIVQGQRSTFFCPRCQRR
ncbi:MAG: bifunctional DNA-formamidopyrimidine glycosylase/DNA-(apurinic or apyrimidinic site) lyase [Piscinibacter sp.]|nr:bifunctional DNA-formamidopyrimidine glycosylase/DNA-(apurinic or apyrimidinic site) lyase [Piscinibacter sp.]